MSSASQPVSKLSAAADNNRDRESLNDLISLIYDRVVDPSRWASACAKVAGYVGGVGCLFEKTGARRQADLVKLVTG
jgi:hypothetical protein